MNVKGSILTSNSSHIKNVKLKNIFSHSKSFQKDGDIALNNKAKTPSKDQKQNQKNEVDDLSKESDEDITAHKQHIN